MASKPSSRYWRDRSAAQEAWLLEEGQAYVEYVDRQYRQAAGGLQKEIDSWYRRFADNNEISYAEAKKWLTTGQLEEFRWSVEDYIRYGKENAVNGQWIKQLENASARVHVSRLEALQLQMQQQVEVLFGNQLDGMDRTMRHILSEGYYHTAFDIQRGIGVGWDIAGLDPKRLDLLLRRPWAPGGNNFSTKVWNFEDRLRNNRAILMQNLETHFTQSLIRGDSPDKVINILAKDMDRSKHAAGRLVMTESAYFASAGQQECYRELGVEQYEIVATLDEDTSEICQALDGQVFPIKDYQPGVTAPPYHPWCRSCTAPHFPDQEGERAARDQEGNTYYVPANTTYEEWKKRQESGILVLSDEKAITEAFSGKEAVWEKGLTSEEKQALHWYTRYPPEAVDMQTKLRSGEALSPEQKEQRDLLHSALSKWKLERPLRVYRGTAGHEFMGNAPEMFVGGVQKHPGFTSTSVLKQTAFEENYIYEITVPKEATGALIRSASEYSSEQEFLLSYDMDIKIVSVEKTETGYNIKAEVVSDVGK